jgi:hypothetical protein
MGTAFKQLTGWQDRNLNNLDHLFTANAGGRTAADWAAIAVILPDREADVATLARIARWNPAHLANLAGLFAADNGSLRVEFWAEIAAQLIDREADVATFARFSTARPSMQSWVHSHLAHLAGLFAANSGGRTAADWAAIAVERELIDREADVAALARIAGWQIANLVRLAHLFGEAIVAHVLNANAVDRTAADWATIAAQLVDREADVAMLARIPLWSAANLASLAQNRANYTGLKTLITARSAKEKSAALASEDLLKFLKDSLKADQNVGAVSTEIDDSPKGRATAGWNSFAKCVELLGRQIPDFSSLTANHEMITSFHEAWQASHPDVGVPDPDHANAGCTHEEGGWIYLNIITGSLSVIRSFGGAGCTKKGEWMTPRLELPKVQLDSVVIARFHTHPWLGGPYEPSSTDKSAATQDGVLNIVVAQPKGPADVTLKYFPAGPNKRAHLAGDQGYPGALGALVP